MTLKLTQLLGAQSDSTASPFGARSRARIRQRLGLAFSSSALVFGVVCCSTAPANEPSDVNVVYVGAPTDEALDYLLALDPSPSPTVLVVDSPTAGATLPAANFTISYHEPASASLQQKRFDSSFPLLFGRESGQNARSRRHSTPGAEGIFEWLNVRAAHAHGVPYSGTAYLLEVRNKDGATVLEVFTDQLGYEPTEAEKSWLQAAPGPLRLEIISAYFEQNEVTLDGGPFDRASISFELQ
jgi:hypothetical protein